MRGGVSVLAAGVMISAAAPAATAKVSSLSPAQVTAAASEAAAPAPGWETATVTHNANQYARKSGTKAGLSRMYRLPKGSTRRFVMTHDGKVRKHRYWGWVEKCPNGKRPYYGYIMIKMVGDMVFSSAYIVPACKIKVG